MNWIKGPIPQPVMHLHLPACDELEVHLEQELRATEIGVTIRKIGAAIAELRALADPPRT